MVTDTDIYVKASEAKRRFPRLDELVPDAALRAEASTPIRAQATREGR